MLDLIYGWFETGVVSIFLFGEYPLPEEEIAE